MSAGWEGESPGEDRHGRPPEGSGEPPRPADDLKAPLAVLLVIAVAFLLGLTILALSMAFD
jgi:hypothetical protein